MSWAKEAGGNSRETVDNAVESVKHVVAKRPSWLGAVLAGIIAGVLAILTGVFGATLHAAGTTDGASSDLEITNAALSPSTIEFDLKNTSDDSISVGQLFIQDQYVSYDGADQPIAAGSSAHVMIDYPWIEEHPYALSWLLDDGSVVDTEITPGKADADGNASLEDNASSKTPSEVWCLLAIAVVAVAAVVVFAIPGLRKSGPHATRSVLGVITGLLLATAGVAAWFALTHLWQ